MSTTPLPSSNQSGQPTSDSLLRNVKNPVWVWQVCFSGILVALGTFLTSAAMDAREKARQATCMSSEKDINLALQMYAQDNDSVLPVATQWMDKTAPYIPYMPSSGTKLSVFRCPSAPQIPYSYAFNSALSRISLHQIGDPATTVEIYDSTAGTKNATDAITSLPSPGRHDGGNNFAFADGHIKARMMVTR